MATSITACGRPGMSISSSGEESWSYKTKAGASTATTERELHEAAENSAARDAKLQFSCDNGSCVGAAALRLTTAGDRLVDPQAPAKQHSRW
jgi:hypothetical protein